MSVSQDYRSFSKGISFEPVRQSAELMKILETEAKMSVPNLAKSILQEVENGDHVRCRMLYKDKTPLAAVVYDRDLKKIDKNQESKIGLCIQNIILFQAAEKVGKNVVFEALIEKVTDSARDLKSQYIFTYSKKDTDEYTFLKNKKFSEVKIENQNSDSESVKIPMVLQIAEAIEKKRKHETPTTQPQLSDQIVKAPRPTYQDNQPKKTKTIDVTLKNVYLQQIKSGEKTIEGRINSGMFLKTREGDLFRFHNQSDSVTCKVTKVTKYKSFEEMLKTEGYKKCLPKERSLESATKAYAVIPGYSEKAARFGVLALHIEKID